MRKGFLRNGSLFSACIAMACVLGGLTSCGGFRPADPEPISYVELTNPQRDTVFSIANEKKASSAKIRFEGILSDLAFVRFASDTAFSAQPPYVVPTTKNVIQNIVLENLGGDSLYIQYQPYKDSLSGSVRIGVVFL